MTEYQLSIYNSNLSKNDKLFVQSYNAMGTDPLCRGEEEIAICYDFVSPYPSKSKPNSSRKRSRKSNTDGKAKKRRSKDDGN